MYKNPVFELTLPREVEEVEIKDILYYEDDEKNLHRFEIVEMDSNIALAIPFESVNGVKKGIDLYLSEGGLQIEYSNKSLLSVFWMIKFLLLS